MLFLALWGCQEPFGTDRHLLEGFRIAAVSAPVADGVASPRAALVVDGRLWSDDPVNLAWSWSAEVVATGPAPTLEVPEDPTLHLRATAPDGTVRDAILGVVDGAMPTLDPGVEVLPLDVATFDLTDLDAAPIDAPLSVGGVARFRANAARTRWMATGGTFFERDPQTAVWAAGTVTVDDAEIVAREPLPAGTVTVLVIGLENGRTTWHAFDVAVGHDAVGAWVRGRWLPADAPVHGIVSATFEADDGAPSGLRLADVGPWETWGDLACASGPFDPDWLVSGRCTRAELVGQRIGLVAL